MLDDGDIHITVVEQDHYWCVCGFTSPVMPQREADMWSGAHEAGEPIAQSWLGTTRIIA